MNLNGLENAFFSLLPINPKSVRGILTVSLLKRTCTLLCLGRRVVGGVVVTLLSNGHRLPLDGAQHLCLSGTFAPDKQGRSLTQHPIRRNRAPGINEVYLGEESSFLPSFLSPARSFAKMNVVCIILACTLLVSGSAVRWVHLYTSFRLTILWKCCTAVVLS